MGVKSLVIKLNPIVYVKKLMSRQRLNHNITIFASNCIGGLIYHDLGLQFLSPTVNTRFDSPDFVRFVCNIEHYLQMNLQFVPSETPFPVALLGDVKINFVHYHSEEECITKWNQRVKRIDWGSVFFILNDNDGLSETDLIALDTCKFKNVLVFTAKEYSNHRCTFQLRQFSNQKEVGNTMRKSVFTGEMEVQKSFDFVGWFNQEKGAELEFYRK